MHRVTACKVEEDYKLWRDVREFEKVSVDPETATVTWEGGIRLDPDILYQDLAARGAR